MSVAAVLAALGDPTRRLLLEKLKAHGALPVGVLAEGTGVSRPAVSQHLAVLKSAGLVREEKRATRRIYSIEVEGAVELRRYLDSMWGEALTALQRHAQTSTKASDGK
jgi:DNA-binding transcriptional ArsR family regulator